MHTDRRRAEHNFIGRIRDPHGWDYVRLVLGTLLVIASVATCALLAVNTAVQAVAG